METFRLAHDETTALRMAVINHDVDLETGACACGHIADPHNTTDRTEHLLEVAFLSGEQFAIMRS